MRIPILLTAGTCLTYLAYATSSLAATVDPAAVVDTYSNIAAAAYEDSLTTAKTLRTSIVEFLDEPSADSLSDARAAWILARVPYQQTEVYRFGNAIVDDWEGKVNAWPLDEGLIDYVDSSYGSESEENGLYTANVIANAQLSINGQSIDASTITPTLLSELHEAGGIESNVATGYHAIEFLLWGQDLNNGGAGAGNRPHTDYLTQDCTNANCDRRAQYLLAATDLLISDLEDMTSAWSTTGEARATLANNGVDSALSAMLTGMGSLSYGELAGERMQLGLMLHDPEEEHDCFADNTAASHYYDGLGIQNVLLGSYTRTDGSIVTGPSLVSLVENVDADLSKELMVDIAASVMALDSVYESQKNGKAYDQLIAEGDTEGNALVQTAIDALVKQTSGIERAVVALNLEGVAIEGSDSLDNPTDVFQ